MGLLVSSLKWSTKFFSMFEIYWMIWLNVQIQSFLEMEGIVGEFSMFA